MGGSVSSGRTNDELIDNLVESNLIRTHLIERVFRCIDRGLYYLPNSKESAYRDLAWRDGPIHISAPCIYTRVMENLELKENLSFLNIGSGTGYLSSMVGLILGPNGINHNIEIHKELIDYAKQKTIEFVNTSVHFDDFDYCVPKFVHGNCINLKVTSDMLLYDRIYVGAGVTNAEEPFFSSLLKINGILIMPLNDSLVKIKRIDEQTFNKKSIMTVSFASLVTTNTSQNEPFTMPNLNPLSLQEMCRYKIRQTLRKSIENEHSDYYKISREKSTFNSKLKLSYEENESSDESTTSDREEEDDDDERNEDFPLTRFERLFRNRHINNVHENNMNFENQLRLMIYGHILDAAVNTTSNTIAIRNDTINNSNNNDNQINDDTDQDEEEEEDDDDMQIVNSDQLISTAAALMEVSETVEHEEEEEEEKTNINLIESSSNESDLNNLASSIESIENNLSEKENSESSGSNSDNNSNHLACSIPRSSNVLAIGYTKHNIPIRRKRQVSSGYQSTSTDFSSSLNDNNNIKLSSDESIHLNEKNESDTDSDHYFDDENDLDLDLDDKEKNEEEKEKIVQPPVEQEEEDNHRIYAISQILQASTQPNTASSAKKIVLERRNLLRDKIMLLPISEGLKQFLLYYRKI